MVEAKEERVEAVEAETAEVKAGPSNDPKSYMSGYLSIGIHHGRTQRECNLPQRSRNT
jgi:hypothetical protein